MNTSRITRVRQVGSLMALATFAVAGVAGCAGDSRQQSGRDQQTSSRQVDTTKQSGAEQGAAKDASAYCSAVDTFNGALNDVPPGAPTEVHRNLQKVSSQVGQIVDTAPDKVRKDWKKLGDGFDRLNDSYKLLDGIDARAMSKLQSASSKEEVQAVDLGPADAKKYEKFQQKTAEISSNVEKSGKKVSKQVQKECGISIGE